jgi:hypothetical protein
LIALENTKTQSEIQSYLVIHVTQVFQANNIVGKKKLLSGIIPFRGKEEEERKKETNNLIAL